VASALATRNWLKPDGTRLGQKRRNLIVIRQM
jgi:hypothetical protein